MEDNQQIEICWMLPLTKDKFRIRSVVKVLDQAKDLSQ
jgi:hypothetical protein